MFSLFFSGVAWSLSERPEERGSMLSEDGTFSEVGFLPYNKSFNFGISRVRC